ncbi:MAG: DUF4169 family protein [Planktomarina sp.]|nr:DUF4169 family protein [Planktomarina sp.]MDT2033701.1 DUF4169 family protein [Planktomarina sp.]MDT2040021.1 DUF4169 family protein [Planktomarina sp.]MDT2049947.1 DUF4169 family protein [Planktomarina sp.]|tara:strand:+ start:1968 stop:2144 length:177 start_codon:yes stop_codon:yes gene_type:complete
MKEPVNLNKFRKNKIRLKKAENGNANAVKFGQTKTEQQKNILKNATQERRLDQAKREP